MVSMDYPEHLFEDRLRYLAELAELHSTITSMATSILETRLSNPFQPLSPTDTRVFQISKKFTELKIVLRENNATVADTKKEVAAARTEVDKSALKLSNLEYEKSHLEKEIRKCEEFETEYETIPLHSVEEFRQLAAESDPPLEVPEDEHELMLARLRFELAERKRLDSRRKQLLVEKTKLIRENETKKKKLDALEGKLDQFIESAQAIQKDMATFQ